MDSLTNAADFYNELMKYKFNLILGKKGKQHIITIAAKSEHFPHIIGLDKLTDIGTSLYKNRNNDQIIHGIQDGEITIQDIEKSSHYNHNQFEYSVKNRIELFPYLRPIIENGWNENEMTFIFIKRIAYSQIDADYLIRFRTDHKGQECYLNLFLKKDNYSDDFIPISFFPRLNDNYEKDQPSLTLLYKTRSTKDKNEELYIRDGFAPPNY